MVNLTLNELKQIAKMRRIKGYNNMSKERLLNVLSESESAKSLDNVKMKKIRERDQKNLYEIGSKKNFSTQKIK